jgi:hypothetical protein
VAEAPPWALPAEALELHPAGAFLQALESQPQSLVYLLLNVGDGDTQLLLLPEREPGAGRCGLVVDVATRNKLPPIVDALDAAGMLAPPSAEGCSFPVVVGTHPHADHIGGMPQFLDRYGERIGEFWEPGYYHTSTAFTETMVRLEERPHIGHLQPTSGTTRFLGSVKITVLSPGVGLRNRFDSYGVDVNNASISLKVEFPAARVSTRQDPRRAGAASRLYLGLRHPWSIVLGADTQTTGWAQAEVDFPELRSGHNPALTAELRAAHGRDHLRGHVFKLPHHASKHGLNLELVKRVNPSIALVSSVGRGGKYQFPHDLSLEATREAIRPVATRRQAQLPDHELGIHYTAAYLDVADGAQVPLGSIAVVLPPRRGVPAELWRLGDDPGEAVDLSGPAWRYRTAQHGDDIDLRQGTVDGQAAAMVPR